MFKLKLKFFELYFLSYYTSHFKFSHDFYAYKVTNRWKRLTPLSSRVFLSAIYIRLFNFQRVNHSANKRVALFRAANERALKSNQLQFDKNKT